MSRKDNDLRFCDIHSYRHININNMKHDVFVSASDDLCAALLLQPKEGIADMIDGSPKSKIPDCFAFFIKISMFCLV